MRAILLAVLPALAATAVVQGAYETFAHGMLNKLEETFAPEGGQGTADRMLEVFLIPHAHCDLGWLKSVPQYYDTEVRNILDTVTAYLDADTTGTAKFHWAETQWLQMWVDEDPSTSQAKLVLLRRLLDSGKLVIIGGGWAQSDEGVADFHAVINQMTEGHVWLWENLGARPNIGWQIDPFGAASSTPRLFTQMGLTKAHVIDRIDLPVQIQRVENKSMEFMWTPSPSFPDVSVFTHVLDMLYVSPLLLDWEGIVPGAFPSFPVTPGNVQFYAEVFTWQVRLRSQQWRCPPNATSCNVLIPFGGDFHFQNASVQFNNMSQVIDFVNANVANYSMHVKYGFLHEYFDAVKAETGVEWPTYGPAEDFIPYGMYPATYWAGYFTSRPTLKAAARALSARQRVAESMYTVARSQIPPSQLASLYDSLVEVRRAEGIMTHHDAVTGTAKVAVNNWYFELLNNATEAVDSVLAAAGSAISGTPLSTVSSLRGAQPGATATVVVWSGHGASESRVVHTAVDTTEWYVEDGTTGLVLPSQIIPSLNQSAGPFELYWTATIPALGYQSYIVTCAPGGKGTSVYTPGTPMTFESGAAWLSNGVMSVGFDVYGNVANISNQRAGITINAAGNFGFYTSAIGDAYEMVSNMTQAAGGGQVVGAPTSVTVFQGPVIKEARQVWAMSGVTQSVRLHACTGCEFVETAYHVGPLQPDVDFFARWNTSVPSGGVLYTDDSGLEMLRRVPDPNPFQLGKNFYPTIECMYIQGQDGTQLSVISDQPHGVTSRASGELEFIVHRRMTQYNPLNGLGEPLNDTSIASGVQWLTVDTIESAQQRRHALTTALNTPPVLLFTAQNASIVGASEFSPLLEDFPVNVHLFTLQAGSAEVDGAVRLRVFHPFPVGESTVFSVPVTVDLTSFFDPKFLAVQTVDAVTLSMNAPLGSSSTVVTVNPHEILSWVVNG